MLVKFGTLLFAERKVVQDKYLFAERKATLLAIFHCTPVGDFGLGAFGCRRYNLNPDQ